MNMRACATVAAGVLFVVAASGTTRSLKAASQSAPVDPMSALLAEVHALRVAMERSGTVTPRVQVTLARLNIEEQRIAQLATQLDQVRRELSTVSHETQRLSEAVPELERTLEGAPDEHARQGLADEQREIKRKLKEQARLEQELRARENDAAQALATEQAHWVELNARLDELERLLAPDARD